jgi:hypothetical protein
MRFPIVIDIELSIDKFASTMTDIKNSEFFRRRLDAECGSSHHLGMHEVRSPSAHFPKPSYRDTLVMTVTATSAGAISMLS